MKRTRQSREPTPDQENAEEALVGLFSILPDDIVVNIIRRLSLKEAAMTSVLSSRWKYLWRYRTNLNFDAPRKLWNVKKVNTVELEEKRSQYINWVNHVLASHRCPNINEFTIRFELFDSHQSSITNWVSTAIAKGVQKLELDFDQVLGESGELYGFPPDFFNYLKSPSGLYNIKSLQSLSLVHVEVSREILEFFVYNCPLLERLNVEYSSHLSGLKVVGPSIRLKYLNLHCCFSVEEVEISAPSLLSFKFYGSQIRLNVENVPLLHDVSIGGRNHVLLRNLIGPIISFFPQLETLELQLNLAADNVEFPLIQLPKLRHLTFKVIGLDSQNLLGLTSMIKACPFLQKFTLKFVHIGPKRRRKIHQFPKCSQEHLKVVELIGFVGRPIDLELAFYFIENATKLEKMIVNPTSPYLLGSYLEFENCRTKEVARRRARQLLQEKIPEGVELVIH